MRPACLRDSKFASLRISLSTSSLVPRSCKSLATLRGGCLKLQWSLLSSLCSSSAQKLGLCAGMGTRLPDWVCIPWHPGFTRAGTGGFSFGPKPRIGRASTISLLCWHVSMTELRALILPKATELELKSPPPKKLGPKKSLALPCCGM